jgi:small GTP-binding protein
MDDQIEPKLILVGDSTVGKTSIVNCAVSGEPCLESVPTVGALFRIKTFQNCGRQINLQIWDTAGDERYHAMTPLYYRGAQVALVVFALDSRRTFEGVDFWVKSVKDTLGDTVAIILVGNKCDCEADKWQIDSDAAREKAEEIGARYAETSALSGMGIDDLFLIVVESLPENRVQAANTLRIPSIEAREEPASSDCC